VDKLSRKLGWHRSFALRAIAEYKRFVYLGVVSNFGVTPSKVIDQVWHEHLLFSRAYRDFCAEVLRCEFDHNPELVPVDEETGVFEAQYRATLDAYEKEFGAMPPADIWAIPKFKMSGVPAGNFQPRLKVQEHSSPAVVYDDTPLFLMFAADDAETEERKRARAASLEGVDFGDSPAGHSGADSGGHHASHSCGDGLTGSSDADSGCAGSDSGSSDAGGGGSSCSSSCGSSCGGGGDGS